MAGLLSGDELRGQLERGAAWQPWGPGTDDPQRALARLHGVMAMAYGAMSTLIGLPGVLVAVKIGVTVFEPLLTTYTVFPLGVIAISVGPPPTLIGSPGLLVAMVIGVTVRDPLLTT